MTSAAQAQLSTHEQAKTMKDSRPFSKNTHHCSLPFLCALGLVLVFILGILTAPYLGFSPQLVLQDQARLSFFNVPVELQNTSQIQDENEVCDIFKGRWVYDEHHVPLYRKDSCPVLSTAQDCQGNGRPDSEYERWRWQPDSCDLPRFNASTFLKLMHGKLLAFVGDSVARNHMESLLCTLMQVERPVNRGNKRMQRWYFPSESVTIVRIWSSWLVDVNEAEVEGVPRNVQKLDIYRVDEKFAGFLSKVDVLVVSTGHWFVKRSVFLDRDGEVLGAQGWLPREMERAKMDNVAAFSVSLNTAFQAIVAHPEYKGLTVLRTYSPDHYEGGAWNSGGSCTGKTKPLDGLEMSGFTKLMHDVQIQAADKAARNVSNGSRISIMDVTRVFTSRADGHPGPYRSQDPNKRTVPDSKGQPPPQDCLHWCLPGPVDTWNDFLLFILLDK